MVKELALIPIVEILDNTERGGVNQYYNFSQFKTTFIIYLLKHIINKNTQNTNLSWKANWVNHQYFLLLENCYLQIVFPATTDKDGIIPSLLETTRRRLWPPRLSGTTERMLQHPISQLLMEGGYDPLVYKILLKGCYDTLFC